MRALTENEVRDAFVNAAPDELRVGALPHDFLLTDWDHLDFWAWRDPRTRGRGYLVTERDGAATGVVLRVADGQSLFTARNAGAGGEQGDTVGTYMCADLSCHENVRLAMPLAPSEIRGSVDMKIDGTKRRTEAFVERVLETAGVER